VEYHHTAQQVDPPLVHRVVIILLQLQTPLARDTKARQPDLIWVHLIIIIPPQLQTLLAQRTKVQQVERTLAHRVVITLHHLQALLAHHIRTQLADQTPMAHRRSLVACIVAPQRTKTNVRLCNCNTSLCVLK